jgi:large subunit ribosomal protein L24e
MVAEQSKTANRVHGEERLRQKKKGKLLVDGGVEEEMDID